MSSETIQKTKDQLLLENEELYMRLVETQETLDAIRNGEVDAIVVSGVDGEKIFSLSSSETPYRIIIEEMNEGAVILSDDGLILYCNRRFAELVSILPDQIAGSYFDSFFTDSNKQRYRDLLHASSNGKIQGEFIFSHESIFKPLNLLLSLSPLPENILGNVCVVAVDISGLKQKEEELRLSYETLEQKVNERTSELTKANSELIASRYAVLNMMKDTLEAKNRLELANKELSASQKALSENQEALRNANANLELRILDRTLELAKSKQLLDETGRLARVGGWEIDLLTGKIFWSEATYRIHEVEPGFEPILETAIDFYAPESIPVISECVNRLSNLGEPFDKELEFITAKNNRIWIRAIGEAYRENGKIVKIGGVFQDINDRKLTEEELKRRSVQLEASNKELEAFSYSVSHDLRAPLRAIHNFTNILREDYNDALDAEGRRICGIIESSSVHMGKLIDDLLSFSRFGRTEIQFSKIDMTKLAKSVYSELLSTDEKKQINFKVDKLPAAFADSVTIKQVMVNLISNAIKYSAVKESPEIEVGCENINNTPVYYVRDNGVGFDMHYVNKLFGVFQRLHSTKEFEGNGVGLAIVQRIIHRHGGKVWAEGEVGKGATFFFTLPDKVSSEKVI